MKFWVAIATATLALAIAGAGTGPPARAATAAPSPLAVSVGPANEGVIQPGQPLKLVVEVDDLKGQGLVASTVVVRLSHDPITTRSSLDSWFDSGRASSQATVPVLTSGVTALLPSENRVLELTVPASALSFPAAGIYPLSVSIEVGGATLASARTAITLRASSSRQVAVALAVPLTVPASTAGFIDATTLAADTAPGGILSLELDQVLDTGMAIGVDPRILASIRVLGSSAPQSAIDWLARLKSATNETFPLSWGDSDLTAALQAGAQLPLSPESLDYAIDPKLFQSQTPEPSASPTAEPSTATGPSTPTLPTSASLTAFDYTIPALAWPRDDTVTRADLPKLSAAGVQSLIVASDNLKNGTAVGASSKVGKTAIVVSDSDVSEALRQASAAGTRAGWLAAMGRLSATLAQISLLSPNPSTAVFATLGRDWQANSLELNRTLTALNTNPWATRTTLSALAARPPTPTSLVDKPQPGARISLVHSMLAFEAREAQFLTIATDPAALTGARRLELLATLSNAWLSDQTAWTTASNSFISASKKDLSSVQVVKSSTVLFLNSQGSLPITVSNTLSQAVTVYVMVRPQTTLLSVDPAAGRVQVTIDAGAQKKLQVPVQSLSNGTVQVSVFLTSSGGHRVGGTTDIDVNVQAGWETAGTLIFTALVVIVFGVGIVRNIRKRRREAGE